MPSSDLTQLLRGCEETLPSGALEALLKEDRPLVVKAGFDPTAADLHLGHTVLIEKLRQFQDMGHQVVFIVGNYTALIGDPSGRNVTRPPLSPKEIAENAKTYQDQAFKILNPKKTKIVFNNDWLSKLSALDLIKLSACQTVARMLERDDFSKRYKNNQPIGIHEFIYPLLQGYDSYHLDADIELGGTDQTFNLLMGREVQKAKGKKPQCIMTMPLLEGLDGVKKMSKSYDNFIGLTSTPKDMFGQLMSISDTLMWRYFDLISGMSVADIEAKKQAVSEGENPKNVKLFLAERIVGRFHGEEQAMQARQAFIDQFSKQQLPDDIPDYTLSEDDFVKPFHVLLRESGAVGSSSEAMRLIKQNAVKHDGQAITELAKFQGEYVIQLGKRRFIRFVYAL